MKNCAGLSYWHTSDRLDKVLQWQPGVPMLVFPKITLRGGRRSHCYTGAKSIQIAARSEVDEKILLKGAQVCFKCL